MECYYCCISKFQDCLLLLINAKDLSPFHLQIQRYMVVWLVVVPGAYSQGLLVVVPGACSQGLRVACSR